MLTKIPNKATIKKALKDDHLDDIKKFNLSNY